jgi:hypothetical protein
MRSSTLICLALLTLAAPSRAGQPFAIEVVDDRTGRGVPLVELRTVNEIRLVTDSRGIVAFDEPGLMDRKVFFHVKSHGYEFPKDGFGNRGKALDLVAGGRARLAIRRVNVAERLYRVTGAGIYRDSLLVGDRPPIREPVLNAQVMGSDSTVNAVFRGRYHWFWGDTNRPGYPLGNFHSPTATSRLPSDGGLDPEVGVDLEYAVGPDGFARPSAPMPGDGPTWIDGLTVLRDSTGSERMFTAYAKVRPPMELYARGLAEFDPETRRFARVADIPLETPAYPSGHPFPHPAGGVDYVYYADPYPLVRVRADAEEILHLDRFEAFTCLLPGSKLDRPRVDRAPDGSPRYAWRRGSGPLDAQGQARLVKEGHLKREEGLLQLRDVDSGRPVTAHRGSVYRNDHRGRWVMIAVEVGGESSYLGEVWFAEADTPLGPWVYARKVLTHDKYSFYNPKQHPVFAKEGGRVIFFEGTYTTTFSGSTDPTPRYDYNQVMYRLDLDDPRLNLPVPIYDNGVTLKPRSPGHPVAFFALERPGEGTIPIGNPPRFHILPSKLAKPPASTTLLYESPGRDGGPPTDFVDEARLALESGGAVGRVWRNPLPMKLPSE